MSAHRRVGVLGGTFDPIHLGHLVVASEVHHALGLDEVVLVPAGRPWQKDGREVTDGEHRLRMVELAVADDDRLRASRVDLDRPGPTYTVDTVADLRAELGADTDLFLLVGADALAGLGSWHDAERLLADVVVVGCARRGHPLEAPVGFAAERFALVDTTVVDVSSTFVRTAVSRGVPVRYLVPDAVERHIRDHGLYEVAA